LTANEAINCLNVWFIATMLSLNPDKTCYMVCLPHKGGSDLNFYLQLNGIGIKKVNSCHYLGINSDNELKWSTHIDHIYIVLLKYVGIFYKLCNKLPACELKDTCTFTCSLQN
jgi:hypothetical protein